LAASNPLPLGEGGERSEPGEGKGPKTEAMPWLNEIQAVVQALTPALSQRERGAEAMPLHNEPPLYSVTLGTLTHLEL